jgi:hypothetical protein
VWCGVMWYLVVWGVTITGNQFKQNVYTQVNTRGFSHNLRQIRTIEII